MRENDGRSWLLIKHRDDWAGDVDIATFAPLSVKTSQDFHEILADDNPDIWHSHKGGDGPAQGGETGAMLRDIVAKAAALKAERAAPPAEGQRRKTSAAPRTSRRPAKTVAKRRAR